MNIYLNKRGDLTLEFVSNMTIFLILVIFITEFTVAGYRHNLALKGAYKICKTLAVQSGVNSSDPPDYYKKFRSKYIKIDEFNALVSDIFIDEVKVNDYSVQVIHKDALGNIIETVNLTDSLSGIKMNYGDLFDVKINYNFPLNVISNTLGLDLDSNGSVAVSSICEYKDYLTEP